jgi:hypothetical protein
VKNIVIPKPVVTALTSYLRAGIASVAALLVAGVTDPQHLCIAFLTAFAGPVIKWLDPTETAFGLNKTK